MKFIKYKNNYINVNYITNIKLNETEESHGIFTGNNIQIFTTAQNDNKEIHIEAPFNVKTNIDTAVKKYDEQMSNAKSIDEMDKIELINIINNDNEFHQKMKINSESMKNLCEKIVWFAERDETETNLFNIDRCIDEIKKEYQRNIKEPENKNIQNIKQIKKPIKKPLTP